MSTRNKLTIDQALQLAIMDHKAGQLQDAEKLYRAILEKDSNHPDANHNLGVIAVSVGKIELAIPFFRKAIEINPSIEQYHKSLNDALRTLHHEVPLNDEDKSPKSQNYPSQKEIQTLINLFNQGRHLESLPLADKMTKDFPKYGFGWKVFGAILKMLDRMQESLNAMQKSVELEQNDAEAYSNLGATLQDLGRLEEAKTVYLKAIELEPNYAEAYYNLGITVQDLGRLEEAKTAYLKAIELKLDYADAYLNLGVTLQDLGRFTEAKASYLKAIELKQDNADAYCNLGNLLKDLGQFDIAIANYCKALHIMPHNGLLWIGFADILQAVRFTSYSADLSYYLLKILEQPTVRPSDVSRAIISALHYHPIVSRALEISKFEYFDEDIDHLTEQLSTVPLLLRVMELSPIVDLDVEKMFTKMRKAMLNKALKEGGEAKGIPFYAALAMQCFVNEYVFTESKEEKQKIDLLQEKVKVTLAKEGTVSSTLITVLGAYRTLNSFSWAENLFKYEWEDESKNVIVGQVDNAREEQALRFKIPCLTSIEDKVSQLVRNQYEESPYPRWINTALSDKPRSIWQVLQSIKLHLNFDTQQYTSKLDILVAGCGTGQQALSTASRFLNCKVLAVDLSLSSLSYAVRKTQELGVTNIEYMQGDILKLGQIEREFNIIESVGVLHHMDEPLAGWKVLVGKLRIGGLMKIGLYSEIARQGIVEARSQIVKKEYTSSPDNIRQYREEIFAMDSDSKISKVIGLTDFYSLSECRDLLFHVQEHRFTLPQIEKALSDLGLKFLGFELKQGSVRDRFIKRYPEKDALVSLSLWHEFELENPDTFIGMYQFWVQKTM